jgi:hypothetical protein
MPAVRYAITYHCQSQRYTSLPIVALPVILARRASADNLERAGAGAP